MIASDSTFSDNSTLAVSGGMYNFGGTASLMGCTVSRNSGNGLRSDGGTFYLTNSLVAGNTVGPGAAPDLINVFVSVGYNLIGISNGVTV